MKKLSILLLVSLFAIFNSFADTKSLKSNRSNSTNEEISYVGYYDKKSKEIVVNSEMSDKSLHNAYNEISKQSFGLEATLNRIEILDEDPTNLEHKAFFCNYGDNSNGSFNVAAELIKIERDEIIYFALSAGTVTHTCTGVKCNSCGFVTDGNGNITGCHCNSSGECNHTVSSSGGGGTNWGSVADWVAVAISLAIIIL